MDSAEVLKMTKTNTVLLMVVKTVTHLNTLVILETQCTFLLEGDAKKMPGYQTSKASSNKRTMQWLYMKNILNSITLIYMNVKWVGGG